MSSVWSNNICNVLRHNNYCTGFEFINIDSKISSRINNKTCIIHLNNKLSAWLRFHFRIETKIWIHVKCKQNISTQKKLSTDRTFLSTISAIRTIFDDKKNKYLQRECVCCFIDPSRSHFFVFIFDFVSSHFRTVEVSNLVCILFCVHIFI